MLNFAKFCQILPNFAKFCQILPKFANFYQTSGGSFSAVSTPQIARVGAFFRIFRDLQELHSFAPLRIQKFCKFSSNFLEIFWKVLENFVDFAWNSSFFEQILMKICRNFTKISSFQMAHWKSGDLIEKILGFFIYSTQYYIFGK